MKQYIAKFDEFVSEAKIVEMPFRMSLDSSKSDPEFGGAQMYMTPEAENLVRKYLGNDFYGLRFDGEYRHKNFKYLQKKVNSWKKVTEKYAKVVDKADEGKPLQYVVFQSPDRQDFIIEVSWKDFNADESTRIVLAYWASKEFLLENEDNESITLMRLNEKEDVDYKKEFANVHVELKKFFNNPKNAEKIAWFVTNDIEAQSKGKYWLLYASKETYDNPQVGTPNAWQYYGGNTEMTKAEAIKRGKKYVTEFRNAGEQDEFIGVIEA